MIPYREGPPRQYWPVYDDALRTVALCPDMQMAQLITRLLVQHANGKKRKRPTSLTKGQEK